MCFKYLRRVRCRRRSARTRIHGPCETWRGFPAAVQERSFASVLRSAARQWSNSLLSRRCLIALLVAIFQVTFFLFAQMNLQNAAVSVGRLIMTGQVQNAGTSQANFLTNDVCPLLGPMFTCANVYANVQSYTNFSGASTTAPTLTYNGSGAVNNTWAYSLGNSGQVMVVQLIYQWPIISGPLHAVLPSISGNSGYAEMMGITGVPDRAVLNNAQDVTNSPAFWKFDARCCSDRICGDPAGPGDYLSGNVRRRTGDCNLYESPRGDLCAGVDYKPV